MRRYPEAMRIILMRHGIAEDAGPQTDFRDEPRSLTAEGITRMERASRGLARLDLGVERIICSPLVRCRQTADIVARVLELDGPTEDPRLRPGAELDAIADILLDHDPVDRVLLCGHQPDMSGVVAELTGGLVEFRKGAVAVIDAERVRPRAGVLRALYPPPALRALAGADD